MTNSWLFLPHDDAVIPAADTDWEFSGALPPPWKLTSGPSMTRGNTGRWVSVPADTPRSYFHPITKVRLGQLIEPARSQILYNSRPVKTGSRFGATLVDDTTTETPFGVGGTFLKTDTATSRHGFNLYYDGNASAALSGTIPDNSTVAFHFVYKPVGTLQRGTFYILTRNGTYKAVSFTAANGGAILEHSANWAEITPDTDGFFSLRFAVDFGSGTTNPATNLDMVRDDGTRTFAGDGTSGFLIAYFGAEYGNEVTTPIISNSTTPASRQADELTCSTEWRKPGDGSYGIQYTPLSRSLFTVLHGSGNDSFEVRTSPSQVEYSVTTGGVNVARLTGAAKPIGTEQTVVVTAGFHRFWLAQDGVPLGVDEQGMAPTSITTMRLGSLVTGAAAGPMLIKRIKYWSSQIDRDGATTFSADLSTPGYTPVLPVIDVQASRTVASDVNALSLTVTLTGEATGAKVNYRTVDDTALAGTDYTAATGEVVFQPGQNVAEIPIALGTRSLTEDRTFKVELYTPLNAVLGTTICTVTLTKATPDQHAPLKNTLFNVALSGDWSLTRTTPGYARDSDGVWKQVAAGVARIHYVAAGEAGILLEPASEQCIFESVTNFYLARSTRTTDTTTLTPTGTRSSVWRETTETGAHLLRAFWNDTSSNWPTGEYVIWAIVKPVGARTLYRFSCKGLDNVWHQVRFDLSGNGSVVAAPVGVTGLIEPEPMWPGWYRIGMARPQGAATVTTAEFDLGPVDANNSNNLVGDTANGFDLCHFQVEPGAVWTSPIPVTGATAKTVRAMDVLKAAGDWYKRNSFALGVKFMRLSNRAIDQRIVQFRDVVPSVDDYGLLVSSAGTLRAPLTTATVFRGNLEAAPVPVRTVSTGVVSIDTVRHALFQNGVKAGERSMAGLAMPRMVEHLRFGSKEQDGSQASPIVVFQAAYWDIGLTDDEGLVFSADLSGVPPGEEQPDPLPTVNIPATLSVIEGEIIEVPITKVGNGACSVNFETKAQTASWSVDYTGVNQVVTFAENESTKLVPVQTVADTAVDAGETFGLLLSAPTGCVLGNATGVVTITEPPRISLPVTASVEEGQVLNLKIDKAGTGACSVTVRTVDPTTPAGNHNNQVVYEVMKVFSTFVPTNTLWVAKTGNDTTGTGTEAAPFLTIQKAINTATAGTAIKVKAGTYAESIAIASKHGTAAAPITLDSADGKHAAIIQGTATNAAIEGYNWSYLAIRGFHIIGGYTGASDFGAVKMHGSVGNPSKYLLFRDNKISGVGRDAFKLFSGSHHCLILGNEINGAWVQEVFDNAMVEDVVYAHNTITGTAGFNTFTMIDGSRRVEIVGNTFNLSDGAGVRIGGLGNSHSGTYPAYWKGEDIVLGGFQAYRCIVRHNTITCAEAPSLSFTGAVECQAIANYFNKNVTINERVIAGDFSHYSSYNTIRDNVFETEPVVTVATGNATGNVIVNNVMGTDQPQTGANQTLIDAYYRTDDPGNAAQPGTDYQPIAATTVEFAASDLSKTLMLTTIINSGWASSRLLDIVATDPFGCRLGNASCRVTIAQQGAVAPAPSPGIYTRAVGFASTANCGEGHPFYTVTNLNDSGAGSLRDAVSVANRHVVFAVGGTIVLSTPINLNRSNITISGETAPWPGIILQGDELQVRASNIRVSHITVEKGHDGSAVGIDNGDCLKIAPGSGSSTFTYSNIHFSHCSFFWSQDEMIEMWPSAGSLSNVSFHDCIFGEALWKPQTLGYAAHTKVANGTQTQHNYGMIIGFGTQNIDVQNSVYHDMDMRFPFIDHSTKVVLANIIALNTTKGATIQHNADPAPYAAMLVTCRGYLCISGPQSSAHSGFRFHSHAQPMYPGTRVFTSNLYGWKGGSSTSTYITPGNAVEYSSKGKPYCTEGGQKVWVEVSTPPVDIPDNPVSAMTDTEIYDRACANAGPRPLERYSHNERSINKLKTKQGGWVNHESEVGGFTAYIKRDRLLDGSATFSDGAPVPALPSNAADVAAVRSWLEHFKVRVQGD